MTLYSRSGRPRPLSGGFEIAAWYFMRLSGVALFVLALRLKVSRRSLLGLAGATVVAIVLLTKVHNRYLQKIDN